MRFFRIKRQFCLYRKSIQKWFRQEMIWSFIPELCLKGLRVLKRIYRRILVQLRLEVILIRIWFRLLSRRLVSWKIGREEFFRSFNKFIKIWHKKKRLKRFLLI